MSHTQAEHIISLDRFAIGHHKDKALLTQLNLTVNRGEMVALIGKTQVTSLLMKRKTIS